MSFDYSYVLPPAGAADNAIVREMFDDVRDYVNDIAAGTIVGTINAGSANRLTYYASAGNTVDDLTAITASRALVSDANGLPIASSVTATELGYVSGVTSAIQTQINALNTNFVSETFLTVSASASLTGERVITAGTAIGFTDGGANSTFTITNTGVTSVSGTASQITVSANTGAVTFSLPQDIATTSSPTFSFVEVDSNATLISPVYGVEFNTSPLIGIAAHDGASISGADPSLIFVVDGTTVLRLDGNGTSSLSTITGALTVGTTITGKRADLTSNSGNNAVMNLANASGHVVSIAPHASFTSYSLVLPSDNGDANEVLITDGSGNLSWVDVATVSGGANTALSNLASVAINTTLVSDTNNTDDLGTSSIAWKDLFLTGALKNGGTTLATNAELGYLTGVTSAIQTQINTKAPIASPTFTGTVTSPGITVTDDIKLTALKKYFFDGGSDTYIYEVGANEVLLVTGGSGALDIGNTQVSVEAGRQFVIPSTKKLLLDGSGAGDTYLLESAANVMDFYAGGVMSLKVTGVGTSLRGTETNDSASAGFVGEYVSSSVVAGSAVTLTNGQYADVTSITLSAGDWVIDAGVELIATVAVTGTQFLAGVGTATGNNGAGLLGGDTAGQIPTAPTAASDTSVPIPSGIRKKLTGSTTYYLKAYGAFTVGTLKAFGRISATRVR